MTMETTLRETETETMTTTTELIFNDQDFKRELTRAIACTDDRKYDWHGVILLDPQEDGSIAVVGTDGLLLYRGFLKPIEGRLTERRIYLASDLEKIIKLIKKTNGLRISFDPSIGKFTYLNSTINLIYHKMPYPRYTEVLMLKEKLISEEELTIGLFFDTEQMGKIMKAIKDTPNFQFSMFSPKDPSFIEIENDKGVFIIMPYHED